MEFVVTVILLCIAAYCVGALLIGYLIARACGIGNIYEHGSGTMGATNVARVLGIPYFFLVLWERQQSIVVTIISLVHCRDIQNQICKCSYKIVLR